MRKSIQNHKNSLLMLLLGLCALITRGHCESAAQQSENFGGLNDRARTPAFQWPLDPVDDVTLSGNNDFSNFSEINSNYYHAGMDIKSTFYDPSDEIPVGDWTEYLTPVRAAADGEVVALYATHDTPYRCGGVMIESSPTLISPSKAVNRGMGNVVVLKHDQKVYTLYAHLDCLSPEIEIGDRVKQGSVIGKMGKATIVRRSDSARPHLHFEVKDVIHANPRPDDLLGDPIAGIYWGYTPDLPAGYGYHDPREFIIPFSSEPIRPVPVMIVNWRHGYLDVHAGPGWEYAKITKIKAGSRFIAHRRAKTGAELWYGIYLPNSMGPTSGWIVMESNDCTRSTCAVEDPLAAQVSVSKRTKIREGPNRWARNLRVHDKLHEIYKNVYVWPGDRYAVAGNGKQKKFNSWNHCRRIDLPDLRNPFHPEPFDREGWICTNQLRTE